MYSGGYHLIKQPLLRSSPHGHTAEDAEAISDETLAAVNRVQSTPWRVNRFVLEVAVEMWNAGISLGVVPDPNNEAMPAALPDDVWERMTTKERGAHKHRIALIHGTNAKLESKRESFMRKVSAANEMSTRDAIWFPHFLDFRTRMYPLTQDLSPQGDGLAKALLEFADGKRLGAGGLWWLKVKIANCAGQDKLPMADRVAWVTRNHDLVMDSGLNPLSGEMAWTDEDFDDQWGFLAAAHEYALAYQSGNPEAFLSYQPIPLDGSTNGLQHLSLMGRDPVGARKTNCSGDPQRYDLYQEVADAVSKLVAADVSNGIEEATRWLARGITRKVVKRAVMTTPYGVTGRGIRDQLVSDGHCAGLEGNPNANAEYLKSKIQLGLSQTVEAASVLMGYFQDCAAALAEYELPMSWVTPAGSRVTQSYRNLGTDRVDTLLGRVSLIRPNAKLGLDGRKQALAAAPNVIHSFDAAMLQKTVNALWERHGITHFAMIHDSYAVHAADTDTMAAVLRLEAASMYSVNRLAEFHEYLKGFAPPGCELPEPPALGTFNVDEVKSARYFFA